MQRDIFAGLIGLLMWATSGYLVLKFLGTAANVAYLPVAVFGTIAVARITETLCTRKSPGGIASVIAMLLAVIAILAIVYPKLDVKGDPLKGSDRDDALNNGSLAMLHGHYPYYYPTYQGLPPSPMPGAFVLAMPFAVIKSSAWQIPLWLGVFAWLIRRLTGDWWPAAGALGLLVFGWAAMAQEIATGGDYSVNGVYVSCAALLLLLAAPRSVGLGIAAAVLTGLTLSSRSPHLMLIPPLTAALWLSSRWRGFALATVVCVTFASITVPYYLYDPAHFGPTMMGDKVGDLNGALPHAQLVIGAIGSVISLAGAGVLSLPLRGRPGGGGGAPNRDQAPIDAPSPHLTSPRGRGTGVSIVLVTYALAMFVPVAIASLILLARHGDPWLIRWGSMAVPPLILALFIPSENRPFRTPPAGIAASGG